MAWAQRTTPQFQPFDIPFIGNDIAKIGRAIDLYAVPCGPTAEIWVYGFFTALPTLFVSILKPDLVDINIRHRHGRPRKGKRMKFIAAAIFRDAIIEIPVPRWVVFRIYEWGQRIGWYLLVADALEDFAINWMSLAYKYNGCTLPTLAYSYKTAGVGDICGGAAGRASLISGADQTSNFNYGLGNLPSPIVDGTFRITYTVTMKPHSIPATHAFPEATHVVIGGVDYRADYNYESGFNERTATGTALVDVIAAPRPTFAVHAVWAEPNKCCQIGGTRHIDKLGFTDLEPDP